MLQVWWLGVILIAIGSLSSAVGLLLMKKSADTEEHLSLLHRRTWMLGFVFLVVSATIIDLFAFSMTPLAFCTVLAQSGWLYKKEDITLFQWLAIAIVFVGVVTISTAGPHSSTRVTEESLKLLSQNRPFMVFGACSALSIVSSVLCWIAQVHHDGDSVQPSHAITFSLAMGAASCGAMSQLCLKIVSTGLADAIDGLAFAKPHAVALVGLIAFAPLQLLLLNSTLTNSPVVFAVPLYQTLLILLTILAGGIFFDEFDQLENTCEIVFAGGVISSIGGLLALSVGTKNSAAAEETRKLLRPPLEPLKGHSYLSEA